MMKIISFFKNTTAVFIAVVILTSCQPVLQLFTGVKSNIEIYQTNEERQAYYAPLISAVDEANVKIYTLKDKELDSIIGTINTLAKSMPIIYLKNIKKWNPDAAWATCSMDLDVAAHVNTMSIFAKWVDSAISKTINVANNYVYDDFKNIYITAWENGIKGFTTYRAGTMTNVLSGSSSLNKIQKTINFPDHYIYNENDLLKLVETANNNQSILVTTTKDFLRIPKNYQTISNIK